jgi:hypothetical protein
MLEILSIPAIVAFVEAVKAVGLPTKYAALLAVATGICFGLLFGDVPTGLVLGLAASGLYSGFKAVYNKAS